MADNYHVDSHDEIENHPLKTSPVNAHFKHPIKILATIISFLSLSIFGLLIATHVLMTIGPFQSTGNSEEAVRVLAICVSHFLLYMSSLRSSFNYIKVLMLTTPAQLFVNFILSPLTILLQIPIIINAPIHIAMLIAIFVFSDEMFGKGWPGAKNSLCWLDTWECRQAKNIIRITMGVSAGCGILTG